MQATKHSQPALTFFGFLSSSSSSPTFFFFDAFFFTGLEAGSSPSSWSEGFLAVSGMSSSSTELVNTATRRDGFQSQHVAFSHSVATQAASRNGSFG